MEEKEREEYEAAVYLRLSKEDGDICNGGYKGESNSITNQKRLIYDFLKGREEIHIYKEYVDDGYSGSDFLRPAFRQMIKEMEEGKVNLIIVKDLSRFGREYIEAGRYLQKVFPAAGVRFIAVTDHYDSLTAGRTQRNIVLPVKNFVNDAYSADLSVKIRSHLESKRRNGEYTGAYVSYGFLKDPNNGSRLIADPVAGENIRRIFRWKTEGMSNGGIAQKLNALGIPAPADYKRSLGIRYRSGFQKNLYSKWSPVAVGRILNNPLCRGMVVQGKRGRINHKIKKMAVKPQGEQSRFLQKELALIGEGQFGTVQGLLEKDTRVSPGRDKAYLFSGLLFCPDCGRQMIRRKVSRNGKQTVFYICKTYNVEKKCTRHSIKEEALFSFVQEALRGRLIVGMEERNAQGAAEAAVGRLAPYIRLEEGEAGQEKPQAKERRFGKNGTGEAFWEEKAGKGGDGLQGGLEKELEECVRILEGLDADRADGILTQEEHQEMLELYTARYREVEGQIEERQAMAANFCAMAREAVQWLEGMASWEHNVLHGREGLARGFLVTFLEKIWVHEGKRVELQFRFRDSEDFTTH